MSALELWKGTRRVWREWQNESNPQRRNELHEKFLQLRAQLVKVKNYA